MSLGSSREQSFSVQHTEEKDPGNIRGLFLLFGLIGSFVQKDKELWKMHKSERVPKQEKYSLTKERNKRVTNRTYPLHFFWVKCYNPNKHPRNLNIYSNRSGGNGRCPHLESAGKGRLCSRERGLTAEHADRPQQKLCKLLEEEHQPWKKLCLWCWLP